MTDFQLFLVKETVAKLCFRTKSDPLVAVALGFKS